MHSQPLANRVKSRLLKAAHSLRTADPSHYVGRVIDDSFHDPEDDPAYARNALSPGAAPIQSQFLARRPGVLSFEMEPLGPHARPADKRDFTSQKARGLLDQQFGSAALRWFDQASEPFRSGTRSNNLQYGAFFGSSFDSDGLETATVSYESSDPSDIIVNPNLARLVGNAMAALPGLKPVFTTLIAGRTSGAQWMSFLLTNGIRLADLEPMMREIGLGNRIAPIMQVVGVALGGRFELPGGSTLVAFGRGPEGVEMEMQIMLDAISDVPPNFLQLLTMNLRERPAELTALERFLEAFTPEDNVWPGRFSILGIRIGTKGPAKINLVLRPVEFEISPAAARLGSQTIAA